ncbi:hypothetical protein GE061_002816 [Apolygus lucorum]|uniref:PROP1-like PPR domain-containing protein n=1 Tax=Apolygus lucorum TaxID=248454 RepID=A0A6A4JM06_APOLU|nr:hypothetical protein GE061_002816 [Apolygus lucorum]
MATSRSQNLRKCACAPRNSFQVSPGLNVVNVDAMTSLCFLRRAVAQFQALSRGRPYSTEKLRDPLPSRRNPNTFGNLSQETNAVRIALSQLPEEEGDVEKVEFIDGVVGKTRMPTFKYSRLIKKLIDKKKLKEALDVLDERMALERAYPDRYTYNLLISGCASQGYTKKAFQLFNQMKKRGIVVSGGTYTSLMNACANSPFPSDGLTRAIGLRELMKEKGHDPNERTYHAMIKAFGRCGDLEQAFSVVDEMLERKKLVSNFTYNFLLQACAANKEAGFRHAVMVWRKMLSRKIKPTIYSYNLLLRCARDCSLGDISTFEEDLRGMVPPPRKVNQQVEGGLNKGPALIASSTLNTTNEDLPTFPMTNLPSVSRVEVGFPNLLLPHPGLESFVSLKNLKQPWQRLGIIGGSNGFLQAMTMSQTPPDIKTFTLLLEALPPTLEAEEELIRSMKNNKVKLDLDFCNLLIKKRAMHFRFDDAKKVMQLILERSLRPNVVTFGVLALACKDFSDAQELFEKIEDRGYRVNVEILGTLFLRASQNYDLKMMRYVLSKMRQEKIKPNKKFMSHINDFESAVGKHLLKVADGEKQPGKIDQPSFIENYEDLSVILKKIKKTDIEDSEMLHPWNQFKQSKKVASGSVH